MAIPSCINQPQHRQRRGLRLAWRLEADNLLAGRCCTDLNRGGMVMAEHYTKGTVAVMKYCNTCRKNTTFKVFNGRLGACENSHYKQKIKIEPEKSPELQFRDDEFCVDISLHTRPDMTIDDVWAHYEALWIHYGKPYYEKRKAQNEKV